MKRIFNSFAIKIIALITMTIDHLGMFLFPNVEILRIIGRISFPLFAFLCAVSMQYSKNKIRYIGVLFGFGVVISLVASLYLKELVPNIFLDLAFGALCCLLISYNKNWAYLLIIAILGYSIWQPFPLISGMYGIVTIMIFYYFYSNRNVSLLVFAFWTFISLYLQKEPMFSFQLYQGEFFLLAIPFIYLYNEERGWYHPLFKYGFYLYYPLHVSIIYLISEKL